MLERTAVAVLALFPLACSSASNISDRDAADANDTGAKMLPADEAERRLLAALPQMPPSSPRRIGERTITAGVPYEAASGRKCRVVHVARGNTGSSSRLACSDGARWFFVPEVFVGGVTRE